MKLFSILFLMCVSALAAEKPNVVILLADDLGWKDIGVYGGPVKTPNLDKLAANGSRFTNFYSGCAVCSPSRAVLLTGRHHIRTGVYSWIHDGSQKSHLLESEITIDNRHTSFNAFTKSSKSPGSILQGSMFKQP